MKLILLTTLSLDLRTEEKLRRSFTMQAFGLEIQDVAETQYHVITEER